MSTKFEHASALVAQKKYKKALTILSKINQKQSEIDFNTVELEALCLYNVKSYQLAKIKLLQAFKLAQSTRQKISIMSNLAAVSEKLNMQDAVIDYLKQSLELDSSAHNASQRFWLINLAFSSADYQTVEKYAKELLSLSQYSADTLLLLTESAINTNKSQDALKYLARIDGEIRTSDSLQVNQQYLVNVLNVLHNLKSYNKALSLLNFLEKRYKSEDWFAVLQNRLQELKNSIANNQPGQIKKPSAALTKESVPEAIEYSAVTGNTASTVESITALKSALDDMGAKFHQAMCIVEKSGDITVTCLVEGVLNEPFMQVPLLCMPLKNDYHFSLDKKEQLVSKAKKNMANPQARHIMELLTLLYNTADKLTNWKKTYPLFALAGSEKLVGKLLEARSNNAVYKIHYFNSQAQISDEAVINSFIDSRVFGFETAVLRSTGIKIKTSKQRGFIPMVELANHQMGAPGFKINKKNHNLVMNAGIGPANREVFVQYNLDDPLVTFLRYGFVDLSADWIYSIPLMLQTSTGLKIDVKNALDIVNIKELSAEMAEFVDYFPAHCGKKDNVLHISKLIIPGHNKANSLTAILSFILKQLDFEGFYTTVEKLNNEVEFIKQQIISLNKQYWQQLKLMVETHSADKTPIPLGVSVQLIDLCNFCLKHIDAYFGQNASLLKN